MHHINHNLYHMSVYKCEMYHLFLYCVKLPLWQFDYRIIIECFLYCVGPVSAAAFYGDFHFHIFLLE